MRYAVSDVERFPTSISDGIAILLVVSVALKGGPRIDSRGKSKGMQFAVSDRRRFPICNISDGNAMLRIISVVPEGVDRIDGRCNIDQTRYVVSDGREAPISFTDGNPIRRMISDVSGGFPRIDSRYTTEMGYALSDRRGS